MKFNPVIMEYAHQFKTIDSHTMGESTRIIYDGFPEIKGKTMMEKKKYMEQNFDEYRKALMLEPRGHKDMFGAVITDPVNEEADIGVIFMDSGGYLNMCGHGSIGTATVAVETGLVEVKEPYTEVVLDSPSGIIRTMVHVVDHRAVEVSILNVPSFLYLRDRSIDIEGYGDITYDISFGGSFFALVDARKIGLELDVKNIDEIIHLGMILRDRINEVEQIKHPYLDIDTVDLIEFYSDTDNEKADLKNCVIFGGAQADRSPCGTGTSAKLAALYEKGQIAKNQPFIYESITGTLFRGEVTKEIEIDGKTCIIPKITGSAYITGNNTWLLDDNDPMEYGFLLGLDKKEKKESIRTRIIRAAWRQFKQKGYEQTIDQDIIEAAQISEQEFYCEFESKDSLLNTLADLFDQKYADLMVTMNPRFNHYEKLLFLNKELFKLIQKQVPFDLLTILYTRKVENKLLDKNRIYYRLITQIIESGQKQGEIKSDISAMQLSDTYASLERGMIYNWCVTGGESDLVQTSTQLLPIYLKEFLK